MNVNDFVQIINRYYPEPNASLINGIVFGIDIRTVGYFYDQLIRVGLLHMVVASGTNISILIACLAIFLARFSKRMAILISIVFIILYIQLIGPQAPIIRAGIISILTLVGIIYHRENISIFALLISLIVIGILYRDWLTSVSLHLSYGATIGMILFSNIKNDESWLSSEIKTTLSASVFTVPIIFMYFAQVSLLAPLSNILVSFTVPAVFLFAIITIVLHYIIPGLVMVPIFITTCLSTYIIWVVDLLSKVPDVYFHYE